MCASKALQGQQKRAGGLRHLPGPALRYVFFDAFDSKRFDGDSFETGGNEYLSESCFLLVIEVLPSSCYSSVLIPESPLYLREGVSTGERAGC